MSCNRVAIKPSVKKATDSVSYYLAKSKRERLPKSIRIKLLDKAFQKYDSNKLDSLKLLSSLVQQAISLQDSGLFFRASKLLVKNATKNRDTFYLADANWSYGDYYFEAEKFDSAYFHYKKAQKYFDKTGNAYYSARITNKMANVKSYNGDYTGSEVLYFKAIPVFEKLKKNNSLFITYNNLSMVYKSLGEYDKALLYLKIAQEYLSEIKDNKFYKESVLNNFGLIYQSKRNFDEALIYYNKALKKDSLRYKSPKLYAQLLDNKAYTGLLKGDTTNVLKELYEAFQIREKNQNELGILISNKHLSDYYLFNKDTISAIEYAKKAKALATKTKNGENILYSLLQLSKLEPQNTNVYLTDYIRINDSIEKHQRLIRNKFTRIDFETEKYIAKTQKLSKQNFWYLTLLVVLLFLILLSYYLSKQYIKNRKLIFEREQEKTNKKIYSLLVEQQTKLKEGQVQERQRLSEELHDGILGDLFGVRMGLDFLKVSCDEITKQQFSNFIGRLQDIEKEIRNVSHKLSSNVLDEHQDFSNILIELFEKNKKYFVIDYQIDRSIPWNDINDETKIHLYRIFQEIINNIIKHANATDVNIEINLKEKNIAILVLDNGIGFSIKKKSKGIGLKNIFSRVKKVNGSINILSNKKNGTKITILVPIKNNMEL